MKDNQGQGNKQIITAKRRDANNVYDNDAETKFVEETEKYS